MVLLAGDESGDRRVVPTMRALCLSQNERSEATSAAPGQSAQLRIALDILGPLPMTARSNRSFADRNGIPVSSKAWDRKSLRWMSLQSTLRSGRVYKKMERDQDDRPLDRVPEDPEEGDGNVEENGPLDRVPEDPEEGDGNVEENGGKQYGGADGADAMAQMLQLNRVPEDPEEGDGNEEENGGEQHGGADGAGAMAQMLQFLIGDRRRRDQELVAVERRLREEELRLAKEKHDQKTERQRQRQRQRQIRVRDRVGDKVRDKVSRDKVRDRDQNDGLVERFNRTLKKMLGSFAASYLDDVIIFSEAWEEHLQYMAAVLERFRVAGLTAKKKKCQFGKGSCHYLGHSW